MAAHTFGGPISGEASRSLARVVGELSNISSDAKRVVAVLERIVDTSADADQTAKDKRIEALMRGPKGNNLKNNYEQIKVGFESVARFKTEPEVAVYRSDINDIENIWEEIQDYKLEGLLFKPPPLSNVDLVTTNSVLSLFKELRREIAFFTIPKLDFAHLGCVDITPTVDDRKRHGSGKVTQ